MNIGNRIKKIRKENGNMTMEKFGSELGVGKTTVCNWENGKNVPTNMIKAICEKFNVREKWLRTGSGDMTYAEEKKQVSERLTANLVKDPESFRYRFVKTVVNLSEEDWEDLERIFDNLIKNRG